MKKDSIAKSDDEMRPEYDLSLLKGGVRGKYYRQAIAGTNLVLIEPDLAKIFPGLCGWLPKRRGRLRRRNGVLASGSLIHH